MSTSVSLISVSASSSVSFSPTFFYTCRTASHGSSPRQTTRCSRSCQSSRSAPAIPRQSSAPACWSSTVVGGQRLRYHVCRKTCVLDCLGDASLHLDIAICGVGVGQRATHSLPRCSGRGVPWVSLPGPAGVLPMPRQDGTESRGPTLEVALCRWWWTCHVDVAHTRILQAKWALNPILASQKILKWAVGLSFFSVPQMVEKPSLKMKAPFKKQNCIFVLCTFPSVKSKFAKTHA